MLKTLLLPVKKMFSHLLMLVALFSLSQPAVSGFFQQESTAPSLNSLGDSSRFLPVEKAFQINAKLIKQQLKISWKIEPEHYLYRSRFNLRLLEPSSVTLSGVSIPRGEETHDEYQGDVEIFRDQILLTAELNGSDAQLQQGVVIEVSFQGCADAGLCYPPHKQILSLVPEREHSH